MSDQHTLGFPGSAGFEALFKHTTPGFAWTDPRLNCLTPSSKNDARGGKDSYRSIETPGEAWFGSIIAAITSKPKP